MSEIVPTVVPSSLAEIARVADACKAFADTIHIDVADGEFAPNTTWMPQPGDMLPSGMRYEVHMMVAKPHEMGLSYAAAGAHSLIGHAEAFHDVENARTAFDAWKAAGISEVQTAALLQTPFDEVSDYVPISDIILLMTIASIGVQGIPFEEAGIARVAEFKKMHPEARIAVDGGVSLSNIERLYKAGATHFCVGSALSKSADPAATYQQLRSATNAVL